MNKLNSSCRSRAIETLLLVCSTLRAMYLLSGCVTGNEQNLGDVNLKSQVPERPASLFHLRIHYVPTCGQGCNDEVYEPVDLAESTSSTCCWCVEPLNDALVGITALAPKRTIIRALHFHSHASNSFVLRFEMTLLGAACRGVRTYRNHPLHQHIRLKASRSSYQMSYWRSFSILAITNPHI